MLLSIRFIVQLHSGAGSLIEIESGLVLNSFAVVRYFTIVALDRIYDYYCLLSVVRHAHQANRPHHLDILSRDVTVTDKIPDILPNDPIVMKFNYAFIKILNSMTTVSITLAEFPYNNFNK